MRTEPLHRDYYRGVAAGTIIVAFMFQAFGWLNASPWWSIVIAAAWCAFAAACSAVIRAYWLAQRARVAAELALHPHHDHHGYAIAKATGMAAGMVQSVLVHMEAVGWLTSRRENANPQEPSRRLYRLTDDGRRMVAEEAV